MTTMTQTRGLLRTEPSNKRVRIVLGGEVIVDTVDALYVWESPHYPQYYVPIGDVRVGALVPATTTQRSPSRGTASYFTAEGGTGANAKHAVDGAWTYEDSPIDDLRGRVRFQFDAMDAWFEEDEEIFVHPRSPSTRIHILPSSRHVVMTVDGITVAESERAVFLHETGLQRRIYLPKRDVRMDLLVRTATTSACPYKGTAEWWTLVTPAGEHVDVAWSYPEPMRESAPIARLIAFYDERVTVTVEGDPPPT